jgi:manganese transport protein
MDKVILGLIPSMPNEAALYRHRNHWGYGYARQFVPAFFWQTRKYDRTKAGIKQALKYNFIDSNNFNLAFCKCDFNFYGSHIL